MAHTDPSDPGCPAHPLEQLRIADPDMYVHVKGRLDLMPEPPDGQAVVLLVHETIQGLAQETGLGLAIADGLLQLMRMQARPHIISDYVRLVRKACRTGATLGRILAVHLVPVLLGGHDLPNRFMQTVSVMLAKGTYTLNAPLAALAAILAAGDLQSARDYLDLLDHTFKQEISYNRSLRLVYMLPKAVRAFAAVRRQAYIRQLDRVVLADLQLVDPFLEGLEKDLNMLSGQALAQFVDQALSHYRKQPESAARFLSLSSQVAKQCCAALQVAVSLNELKVRLNRYLQARLGHRASIGPMSGLPRAAFQEKTWVCSDGRCVYLPDEIDCFASKAQNLELGKVLVRLEAGFFEHKSHDFDLERACDRYPAIAARAASAAQRVRPDTHDVYTFCNCFGRPALARDLLDLCEQARVLRCMGPAYPGLLRAALPVLADEVGRMRARGDWNHILAPLYGRLVLGAAGQPPQSVRQPQSQSQSPFSAQSQVLQQALDLFEDRLGGLTSLESCAAQACRVYDAYDSVLSGSICTPFQFPFGRRLRWDFYQAAFEKQARLAYQVKLRLAQQNVRVYRADVQTRLTDSTGQPGTHELEELVLTRNSQSAAQGVQLDWSKIDLPGLLRDAGMQAEAAVSGGFAGYYPEWDVNLQDYLHNHTRVQEVPLPEGADGEFYRRTLLDHRGLVARTRRAFEWLKPEGLALLRQWPEGDEFDYRAMLDFAIDRKAGMIPSDRLFIKRLKQQRDVAVLLLVDMSRSTANRVAGGQAAVLDVARQALVLFCEALQVVGDAFAIAGFSGTGRHSVDYFRIKDFSESLGDTVKARISALRPQRGTRMGAAVRHATAQLQTVQACVRLIILVSDGFPNDLGYKSDYAIADTRRALQEARARNFHVKAITVNIGSDPRLDDLYGRVHHHVIGDVRDLPDKLLRLYGTLTRS